MGNYSCWYRQQNFFDIDFEEFGALLPQVWIKSLWEFIYKYNIEITGYSKGLQLKRRGDKFLMEEFAKGGFSSRELMCLNRCRHYNIFI